MSVVTAIRRTLGNIVLVFGFLGMTLFGLICISGAWLADRDEFAADAFNIMRGKKVG